MEKQQSLSVPNMNHNTRLYVSFDSPHLGANIPLSLQTSIFNLGYNLNHSLAKSSYDIQLRSKAARQMLIEQPDGLNKDALFYKTYYNTNLVDNGLLNSNGWPLNLRKVAVINGAANGVKTGWDNDKIFDVKINKLNILEIKAYSLPLYGQSSSPYLMKISGKVMPGNLSSNPVIAGFQLLLASSATFTKHFYNENENGAMDATPGGRFNTNIILLHQIQEALMGSVNLTINEVQNSHCFIPSVSALAFKNPNFDWSTSFNNRNLVCTDETPFDNYFTPTTNDTHIYISEASAKWIMEEIDKGQVNCPSICNSSSPVVNDLTSALCVNSTRTLSHNFIVPAGCTVTWSVSGYSDKLSIVSSNNNSVTVKGLSATSKAVVAYKINNPCGASIEGSFPLRVGVSEENLELFQIEPNTNKAQIRNFNSATNDYYWKLDNGSWNYHNVKTYPYTFTFQIGGGNNTILCLKTSNQCGEITECVSPYILPVGPMNSFVALEEPLVYPNPTTGDWTIVFNDMEVKQMQMFNRLGSMVWKGTTDNYKTTISGKGLAAGVYLLKVSDGKQEHSLKLIKK